MQGIICGAHNFVEGDKVVVTLPGAVLPGDFKISARKTYGHLSAGMIASSRELGIGDDHDGIIVLSRLGLDPEIGTDAMELLGLYDQAAEINVTPDRSYAFSIRGVAREFAHATGTAYTDPASLVTVDAATGAGHPVKLADTAGIYGKDGCDRFVTRSVTGVDPSLPTPPWMASRLSLAGMRSISLVVDVSNYVMLELGQPLHFYDADKLTGEIVVRRANPGETLKTLDGKERKLHVEDLLITDGSGAIGIAGVMGGGATEVSDSHRQRADRGRALRADLDRPLAPPPQAALRGVQALRARRGLGDRRRGRPARGRPAGRARRRHRHHAHHRRGNRAGRRRHRAAGALRLAADRRGLHPGADHLGADRNRRAGPGRRRRLPGDGPVVAPGPGHQAGPDRGNRPPGGLPPDPGDASDGPSGPRPDPHPVPAPPRHGGPGRLGPHRGAVLPVRFRGAEQHLRRRRLPARFRP